MNTSEDNLNDRRSHHAVETQEFSLTQQMPNAPDHLEHGAPNLNALVIDETASPDIPEAAEGHRNENSGIAHGANDNKKQLTAWDGFVLLISVQIGSGIFTSPSQVNANVSSPGMALVCWLVAGLLAWTGALCFAELGAALPASGGMQEYLRYVYGDLVAFSMVWMWTLIVKPTAIAILAIVLIESVLVGFGGSSENGGAMQTACALLVLWATVIVNGFNADYARRLSVAFVFSKLATVALVALGAIFVILHHFYGGDDQDESQSMDWLKNNWFNPSPDSFDRPNMTAWESFGHFCAAVYGGLWSYSGWDNANFLANEMKDVHRSLPRAINMAMLVVTIAFQVTSTSYYIILPWKSISDNDAIAVSAARLLLGTAGGVTFGCLVAISCLGALNGNVQVTGRLSVAAAAKGYLPRFLSLPSHLAANRANPLAHWAQRLQLMSNRPIINEVTHAYSTLPGDDTDETAPAFVTQKTEDREMQFPYLIAPAIVSSILITFGTFRSLVTFIGMIEYAYFFATVIGLLILRKNDASILRSYSQSIAIPILFAIVSGTILVRSVVSFPMQAILLLVLYVVGIGIRTFFRDRQI